MNNGQDIRLWEIHDAVKRIEEKLDAGPDSFAAGVEAAAKTVEGRKALYPDSATSNAAFSAKLALSEAASSIRALAPEPTPTSAEEK